MPKQTRVTDTQEQQNSARRKAQPAPATQAATGAHLQRLPDHPAAATPADVAQLQNRYGNRAVQRLLSQHTIQAKLEVGPANDHYEQEADQVAQTVMRMADPQEEDEKESG
jgi:hypothetical protein